MKTPYRIILIISIAFNFVLLGYGIMQKRQADTNYEIILTQQDEAIKAREMAEEQRRLAEEQRNMAERAALQAQHEAAKADSAAKLARE